MIIKSPDKAFCQAICFIYAQIVHAIADFGLAVFFEPSALPRRDLGLEGTPWFMSPETLSSEVATPCYLNHKICLRLCCTGARALTNVAIDLVMKMDLNCTHKFSSKA